MAEKKGFEKLSLDYLRETFGDESVRRVFGRKKVKPNIAAKVTKAKSKKKPLLTVENPQV